MLSIVITDGPAATADPPSPPPAASLEGNSPPRSPRKREAEALLEEGYILPSSSKRARVPVQTYDGEFHSFYWLGENVPQLSGGFLSRRREIIICTMCVRTSVRA